MRVLIYNCEIIRAIPHPAEAYRDGIEYCAGWYDFEHMGVACVGAWCSVHGPRLFLADNLGDLQRAADAADVLVSFNGTRFDDPLLAANGVTMARDKVYDLQLETILADGKDPGAVDAHKGYSLEKLAQANLGRGKSGHGELAPILWQMGHYGQVLDYCLQDVELTRLLFVQALRDGLRHPGDRTVLLYPRDPPQVVGRPHPWPKVAGAGAGRGAQ